MVNCAIKFDKNPLGIFYSGSVINGKVEIFLEKPMNVRGISLIISGKAYVHWTETESTGSGNNQSSSTSTYTATENYINTTTYLHGSPDGNTISIGSGEYVFNFACLLPPQLPSSVEGYYGHIRYSAKVVFDRPWKFDKTFTVGITVIKITDLNNEDPTIRLPATLQVQKQFCCWPCASKPLIVQGTIPETGYVSGQHIPVKVNLFNESGKQVHHIEVILKQIIKCTSSFPLTRTKIEQKNMKEMVIGSIKNLPKEDMNVNLLVPPVPPTCLESTCGIIQVYYEVHVKAYINGPHISPIVAIPIVIGNIPLNNYQSQPYQLNNNLPSSSTINVPSQNSPEISAAEFGLAPPTYEEALYLERINMNQEEKHPISESTFLPRYPVFNFESIVHNNIISTSDAATMEAINEKSKILNH